MKISCYKYFLFLTILLGNINLFFGQQISTTLDSIHRLDGSDNEKMHLYDSLFDHYKEIKNYTQLGSDAYQLTRWLSESQKKDKAIEIGRMSLEARKIADPYDPKLLRASYGLLGGLYTENQNYEAAIELYLKTLEIEAEGLSDEYAYVRLSGLYKKVKDYYKAIEYLNKSFASYDNKTVQRQKVWYHKDMARLLGYIDEKKHFNVIENHLLIADSLNKDQKIEPISDGFLIKTDLARLYLYGAYRDLNKSKLYFQQALKYVEALDKNEMYKESAYQASYHNMGFLYMEMDSLDLAEKFYLKALEYETKFSNKKKYLGLALLEEKRKNYSASQEYFQKTISNALGYDNTKPIDSITPEELKDSKYTDDILSLLFMRTGTYFKELEENKNILTYNSIFNTVEMYNILIDNAIEKAFSFETKLSYKNMESSINIAGLEAAYQLDDLERAFHFMEKNKALLLMQDIGKERMMFSNDVMLTYKEMQSDIKKLQNKEVIAWGASKDSLTVKINNLEEKLISYKDSVEQVYPDRSFRNKVPDILCIEDVKVEQDEMILQYVISEKNVGVPPCGYTMAISNTGKKLFKLNNITLLLNRITKFRNLLSLPFRTAEQVLEYNTLAYELYKQLFPKEIRDELILKKVRIIPDHMLGKIPFEALIIDPELNTYLIEEVEVSYDYSLSFSEKNRNRKRVAEEDFFGIAPVNFEEGLTLLKNSSKEIKVASDFYGGNVLLDKEATKENYVANASKYRILHLATHASAEDLDTILPWVAFYKGKLTYLELGSIKNNADLVILSACNTSLGNFKRGEGTLSLARGFFRSGAKSVIASLWSTNDKAVSVITSDFYENLSKGQTKSEALRNAKLNYLHTRKDAEASPYYWASLILIGDNGVLLPTTSYEWLWYLSISIVFVFFCLYANKKINFKRGEK
ncbi:hypothetical protein GCM10009430_38500 [Aquimarina litoralis]|uniref:CHAT domain-containing protein n=1 Tax=Aquimarina litoralis TaxID=584605 RepID=A0ABN1J4Z5_9FLAO